MSAHIGKIGRLNVHLRHTLGLRLENNEPAQSLVDWLNDLPEVKESLKFWFEGRKITEQNLSEWRQGGHVEWLRLQETRRLADQLAEDTKIMEEAESGQDQMADRLSVRLATELARLMTLMVVEEKDTEKRWKQLKEVHAMLSQMRKDDHRALKARIERQKWEDEKEAALEARMAKMEAENRQKLIEQVMAPVRSKQLGAAMGIGKLGEDLVELTERIRTGQPWIDYQDELIQKWMREDQRKELEKKKKVKNAENPTESK
jgi:hypothetical protein